MRNYISGPPIDPRIERKDLPGNMVQPREKRDGARGILRRVELPERVFGADFLAPFLRQVRRHFVSRKPGSTTLQRILRAPYSFASDWPKPTSPAFAAA